MSDAPPPSYATEAEARAYVGAVLARTPPGGPGRVYVIAPPAMLRGDAHARILATVGKMLPGATLADYRDVFGGGRVQLAERLEVLTGGAVTGAVVLARAFRQGESVTYLLGGAARAEARALVAAGLPVLVLAPAGLVAWPDVRTRPAPEGFPPWYPWVVDMPAPSPVLLPTVAASYRAMGLPRPRPPRRVKAVRRGGA